MNASASKTVPGAHPDVVTVVVAHVTVEKGHRSGRPARADGAEDRSARAPTRIRVRTRRARPERGVPTFQRRAHGSDRYSMPRGSVVSEPLATPTSDAPIPVPREPPVFPTRGPVLDTVRLRVDDVQQGSDRFGSPPALACPYRGVGMDRRPNIRIADQCPERQGAPALVEFAGRLHMVHLGDSSNFIWHSTYALRIIE